MEHIKQVDKHTGVILRSVLKIENFERLQITLLRERLQELLNRYPDTLTEDIQYEIEIMIKELDFEVPRVEYMEELIKG